MILAAIVAAAASLRFARLNHPMRYDESWTYLQYLAPGQWNSLFQYAAPNNHVLHTLLAYLSTQCGGISPPALRFPSLLAGIALVAAAGALARRISGRRISGLFAAGLVGASSLLIEYSVNARGYSMLSLLALGMGLLTQRILERPQNRTAWATWAVLGAAGVFTVPVMLYPTAVLSAVLMLQFAFRRLPVSPNGNDGRLIEGAPMSLKQGVLRLVLALGGMAALAAALYCPVIYVSGAKALLANEFIRPREIGAVLSELPGLAARVLADWTRDTSWPWRLIAAAGLVACVGWGLKRRAAFWLVPLVAPLLLALGTIAQRVTPFPRVFLPILPLLLVAASCGMGELARRLSPKRWPWLGWAVAGLLTAFSAGDSAVRSHLRTYLISEDPRTLVAAEPIIADAAAAPGGPTALLWDWDTPNWPPLLYYAVLHGAADEFASLSDANCLQALLVTTERAPLGVVLAKYPELGLRFSAPVLWKEYPGAWVFLAKRLADARGEPASRPLPQAAGRG